MTYNYTQPEAASEGPQLTVEQELNMLEIRLLSPLIQNWATEYGPHDTIQSYAVDEYYLNLMRDEDGVCNFLECLGDRISDFIRGFTVWNGYPVGEFTPLKVITEYSLDEPGAALTIWLGVVKLDPDDADLDDCYIILS